MYEYNNEHNESLFIFSGAVGAAQHINITTLIFSGVTAVCAPLSVISFSGASAVNPNIFIHTNKCSHQGTRVSVHYTRTRGTP